MKTWQIILPTALLAIAFPRTEAQCSVCTDGFDAAYADFEIPQSGGLTCAALEAAAAVTPSDSEDCMAFTVAQGFCCPKCYMCGSAEDDAAMESPMGVILSPRVGLPLSCLLMSHIYHMLSYPSASQCPANPSDLDTSWYPGEAKVAYGFDLRGFCGCPGFTDAPADEDKACPLCPEGKVVDEAAQYPMFNVTFDCWQHAKAADYFISEVACIEDLDRMETCCVAESTEVQDGAVPIADIAGGLDSQDLPITSEESDFDSEDSNGNAPTLKDEGSGSFILQRKLKSLPIIISLIIGAL